MNTTVELPIIGVIHTPHLTIENMPIQPTGASGVQGFVELHKKYAEGLTHLDGFSHMILLYHLHMVKTYELKVTPFMDDTEHGIFATRSPKRPAAIGLSTVKILKVEDSIVQFEGADMLNGSPLFDIKPFFRTADNRPDAISGWLEHKNDSMVVHTKSDTRFCDETVHDRKNYSDNTL